MRRLIFSLPAVLLVACGGATAEAPATAAASSGPAEGVTPPLRADLPYGDLSAILAADFRPEEERARDAFRHPAETLAFFGVAPGKDVMELWPGRGWYTKILAPLLHDSGSLVVATTDPSVDGYRGERDREMAALWAANAALYGNMETVVLDPPGHTNLGEPESVDVVLTFRNTHNWLGDGTQEAVYAAAFRVLRPGGVLGVVQHRDADDATPDASRGYLPTPFVVATAEAAGFVLDASSEVNANGEDTKDHPSGVWSLPPALRGGEDDADRFRAIGESDRMTLRFVKPAR
ncbi:MAG: methyltransferase [Myxococcota bacterium]